MMRAPKRWRPQKSKAPSSSGACGQQVYRGEASGGDRTCRVRQEDQVGPRGATCWRKEACGALESASGARGFNRGLIYNQAGELVASTTQEGLVRIHPGDG